MFIIYVMSLTAHIVSPIVFIWTNIQFYKFLPCCLQPGSSRSSTLLFPLGYYALHMRSCLHLQPTSPTIFTYHQKCKTSAFIHLPQSQKYRKDWKLSSAVWKFRSELRTQLRPSVSIVLTVYFQSLSPSPLWWYEGRTKNTESWKKISQYSMLLSHISVMAQWF
jgi:hypothetical protein